MNGLNEIKNINRQAVVGKATELKHKARAARSQNHPNANAIQGEYDSFKQANADALKAGGFNESE